MAWFAVSLLILASGLFVASRLARRGQRKAESASKVYEKDGGTRRNLKMEKAGPNLGVLATVTTWSSGACTTIAALLFISASIKVVNPGYVGIKILFGSADNEVLPEGLHFVNPFSRIETLSTRTLTYTMSAARNEGKIKGDDSLAVLSKDGMTLNMDLTVTHRLSPKFAAHVYRCYGKQYEDTILRPQVQEVVRTAAKQYVAQEVYAAKRDELAINVLALLRRNIKALVISGCPALNGMDGLIIEQALIRNITLPDKVKNAIEDKLEAEQKAQKMQFVLARERQEAERKKVEAGGIQQFQDIVRKGIDERLLRWKGIEATVQIAMSPNAKMIIMGGKDGLPLLMNQDGTASPIVGQQ